MFLMTEDWWIVSVAYNDNKAPLDLVSYIPGESPLSKTLDLLLRPPEPAHNLTYTGCPALSRHPSLRHGARQRGGATRHHYCLTGSIITCGKEIMGFENFRLKREWVSKKVRRKYSSCMDSLLMSIDVTQRDKSSDWYSLWSRRCFVSRVRGSQIKPVVACLKIPKVTETNKEMLKSG
jgi:hypothetical protein